jgi:hypothetical protein
MNPMTQYPPRPTLTGDLLKSAVQAFLDKNPGFVERLGSDSADDIASEYHLGMDGFELCKRLEKWCDWDIDREDMETLDGLDYFARQQLKEAEHRWMKHNNIQPPYPIGSRIKCTQRGRTGVIDEVCEYSPGCYLVIPDERSEAEAKASVRWVCEFEKVELVEQEAA